MRRTPPQLSPADRRDFVADLLARRLLDLASRGILLEDDEDEADPDVATANGAERSLDATEARDGAR